MGVSLSYKLKGPWRWLSGPLRVLPDFLIPGVQKSGTTSLYNYLVQHPAVAQPCIKEIHYFDKKYRYGVRWYRGRFPTRHYMEALSRRASERAITGEASTHHLFHPLAAERITPLLPEVKTIVVLRNPVERTYSHYQHQVRAGRETLTFEQAIERELDWMAAGQGKMLRRDGRFVETYRQFSYLSRGLYAEQLQRWWRHLPKERSLIYLPIRRRFTRKSSPFSVCPHGALTTLSPLMPTPIPISIRRPASSLPTSSSRTTSSSTG